MGSYPAATPHDPETYLAAVAAELRQHSLAIGERAAAKLVQTIKFPPSVAEVAEACRALTPSTKFSDDYDARSCEQLAERARLEAPVGATERERIIDGFDKLLKRMAS